MSKYKSQLHPAHNIRSYQLYREQENIFQLNVKFLRGEWDLPFIVKYELWNWTQLIFEAEGHCKLQELIGFQLWGEKSDPNTIFRLSSVSDIFRYTPDLQRWAVGGEGGGLDRRSYDSWWGVRSRIWITRQIKIRSQSSPAKRFPTTASEIFSTFSAQIFSSFCSNIFRLSPIFLMNRLQGRGLSVLCWGSLSRQWRGEESCNLSGHISRNW